MDMTSKHVYISLKYSGMRNSIFNKMEVEGPLSYAKLWSPELEQYITKLPVNLGRKPGKEGIQISTSKKISKSAAVIDWDDSQRSFVLKRIGKTKVYANKAIVNADN
jgi:hypothetical protein